MERVGVGHGEGEFFFSRPNEQYLTLPLAVMFASS